MRVNRVRSICIRRRKIEGISLRSSLKGTLSLRERNFPIRSVTFVAAIFARE